MYPPLAGGGFNTGGLGDLRLLTTDSAPAATANVEYILNLPANAAPPPVAPFDPERSELLQPGHLAHAVRFARRDAHRHDVLRQDGHSPTSGPRSSPSTARWSAAPQTLQYSNTGLLTAPVGGLLAFPAYTPTTGAADMKVTVDLAQSTQFGGNFAVNAVTQDGYTTGRLIGIDISDTGIVQARFTNGNSQPLGQVAIANFANPQGLQQLGNTQWAETFASGQALRGQAGNSGFGLVQSGALEARQRRRDRAAGEHDHRAAQLPGERADDLHRRPDHADHHQHALMRTGRRGS